MKISELNEDQKGHLAYQLEHNTYCGLITSNKIARGEFGDLKLEEAFIKAEKTPRSAKILATKVMNFKLDPDVKFAIREGMQITQDTMGEIHRRSGNNHIKYVLLCEKVIEGLTAIKKGYDKYGESKNE